MSGMQPRRTHVKWKEVEEEIPSVYLTDDDHRPHIVRNARSAVFASRKPTRRACFLIRYATVHALSPTPIPPPLHAPPPTSSPFFPFSFVRIFFRSFSFRPRTNFLSFSLLSFSFRFLPVRISCLVVVVVVDNIDTSIHSRSDKERIEFDFGQR